VAHPRKMQSTEENGFQVPTLYDISGSANFYNKADYGLTQHIDKKGCTTTYIQKVKNKWMGKNGYIDWTYNSKNGRFYKVGGYADNTSIFKEFNLDKFKPNLIF
jgi:twinkle protein